MLESIKDTCTGCSACANLCPKQAITMEPNSEGFLYPTIDNSSCVKCGLCERTCPILNPFELEISNKPLTYAVQNKDELVRKDSTSGGAFSGIAQYVLDRNGVVFGAMFDENFDVVHGFVEKSEDLWKLRRSKYVQSLIGNTFKQAKSFLDDGRWACFSGTPCQIGGLKKFLKKNYEKLITIDIACHGVPSPKFWTKYKDYQEKKHHSKLNFVDFRYKKNGYSSSVMALKFKNGKEYYHGHESDYMLKAFFREIVSRKSCSQCFFKSLNRVSDFTIYDCWSVGKFKRNMDDNKGTTTVMIQSEKGNLIWKDVVNNFSSTKISTECSIMLDGEMIVASKRASLQRDPFFKEMDSCEFIPFCNKYIQITIKDRIKSILKPFLYKTGLLKKLNNLKKALKRK